MKGEIFILSAPAGSGKTTISQLLLKEIPNLKMITTCTTRKKREGEIDGEDYHFLTEEEFKKDIKEGNFLEYAVVHGNYYGTPKKPVLEEVEKGNDVLLVIDIQGMKSVKKMLNGQVEITTIFILPPSIKEMENRMKRRGETEEEMRKRFETAKREIPNWKYYDYLVINDILEEAKNKIKTIILAQRNKTKRFDVKMIKDEFLRGLMLDGKSI